MCTSKIQGYTLKKLEEELPQEAFIYMGDSWGNSSLEIQLIASLCFVDGAKCILNKLKDNE